MTIIFSLESNYVTFNADHFSPALLYGGWQGPNPRQLPKCLSWWQTGRWKKSKTQVLTRYKKMKIVPNFDARHRNIAHRWVTDDSGKAQLSSILSLPVCLSIEQFSSAESTSIVANSLSSSFFFHSMYFLGLHELCWNKQMRHYTWRQYVFFMSCSIFLFVCTIVLFLYLILTCTFIYTYVVVFSLALASHHVSIY